MRAPSWFGWGLALLLATLVACTSSPEQTPAAEEPSDSRTAAPAAPASAAPASTAEPASTGSGGASVATAEPQSTGAAGTVSLATAEPGPAGSGGAAPAATAPVAAPPPDLGFPTGPAVLVVASYEPPTDRVDSTGAFLPANGKPTLVFVDAIW